MSSYERKGLYRPKGAAVFVIRISRKGRRIFQSTGTEDEVRAAEFYDKFVAGLWDRERLGIAPDATWEDAVKLYLRKKSHLRTFDDSIARLRWLDQFLGGLKLSEIDDDLIDDIRDAKKADRRRNTRGKEVSDATVNRVMDLIRTILEMAQAKKWIVFLPEIESKAEPKRVRFATDEEIRSLFRQLPEHYQALVRFALSTGLRARNIRLLRWDQIDFTRKVIHFTAEEMKGKKHFVCHLNSVAVEALRSQIGRHQTFVFVNKRGEVFTSLNTGTWRRALERAGITNIRFHDLRHTWATWHLLAGTPLLELQRLGGWSSLEMVLR